MERGNLEAFSQRGIADYQDNVIALVSDIGKVLQASYDSILMETYFTVLILKGSATIFIGEEEIDVGTGDLFVCLPQNILKKSMVSMDIEIRGFFVAKEKVEELLLETDLNWNFRTMTTSHDVVHMSAEKMNLFCLYYDLLNEKLNASDSPYKYLTLRGIFSALVYEIVDIFTSNDRSLSLATHSPAENIFERFIHLLEDPHQPFVTVNEYAALLHITPKYFSSVCKKLSGKTAKEIIKDETIKQAKILLRNNSLSIKQVADRLNFANQSHFGTYFHRYTGMSPQQFKNKN